MTKHTTHSALDFRDRPALFASLEEQPFDVLVIGAGITGCGIARDAAMRGLRVALVDARDIASGTSSRSSKLVHGGMRYLAEGQVHLVREASTERKALRRIAPHLAQETLLLVPAKTRKAMLALKAALVAYERLGKVAEDDRHEVWDPERIREEEPHLVSDGIVGAVVYPEYITDDARLTLANARSAASAGAVVATYAPVTDILVEDGRAVGAIIGDGLADAEAVARVRAKVIVNAAGPWVDAVRKLEDNNAPPKLQLTKGIHVTFPRERLPIRQTVIMTTPDKRSIFVVPRGRFVYFGTTDTYYAESQYWPEITLEDVDYLLNVGNETFDNGPFDYSDVVSMWSGLRPLLAQEGKSPSEISRKDETMIGPAGVLSIAGGKLTSYRSMAERVVGECQKRLGQKVTDSSTADVPLPGGDLAGGLDMIEAALQQCGLSEPEAERAARLYGAEADTVYRDTTGPAAEAAFAVTHEGALTLEDYWVRRSARARFDDEGGVPTLETAAGAMGTLLGWSGEERERQIAACLALREREMACLQQQSQAT